jgi:hypothetical protein
MFIMRIARLRFTVFYVSVCDFAYIVLKAKAEAEFAVVPGLLVSGAKIKSSLGSPSIPPPP